MARIRSTGNASTELRVIAALRANGIKGWRRHVKHVLGRPDFYFAQGRLALFIDGCFWHGCPRCGHIPKSNVDYWEAKIGRNRRRDAATRRVLVTQGYHVVRLWEHQVRDEKWVPLLLRALEAARALDVGKRSDNRPLVDTRRRQIRRRGKGGSNRVNRRRK